MTLRARPGPTTPSLVTAAGLLAAGSPIGGVCIGVATCAGTGVGSCSPSGTCEGSGTCRGPALCGGFGVPL